MSLLSRPDNFHLRRLRHCQLQYQLKCSLLNGPLKDLEIGEHHYRWHDIYITLNIYISYIFKIPLQVVSKLTSSLLTSYLVHALLASSPTDTVSLAVLLFFFVV